MIQKYAIEVVPVLQTLAQEFTISPTATTSGFRKLFVDLDSGALLKQLKDEKDPARAQSRYTHALAVYRQLGCSSPYCTTASAWRSEPLTLRRESVGIPGSTPSIEAAKIQALYCVAKGGEVCAEPEGGELRHPVAECGAHVPLAVVAADGL
eukprot:TRINITY_DN5160_c0_g2_i4.p2 TRINITY_DN5160_c0_g2~~TRINITY_DN5160_c0_g2_i4.p2  ORF type:complete len:152 (+),score=19.18 TRINITY_DN5160_c0_g2_i4:659-1114(+)